MEKYRGIQNTAKEELIMEHEKHHGYKCIKKLHPTLLILKRIDKADGCTSQNWEWRLDHVGTLGLAIITTIIEGEYDGMSRIEFEGEERRLKTGFGTLIFEDRILTLRTKNTIWVFKDTGLLPSFFAGINDMS